MSIKIRNLRQKILAQVRCAASGEKEDRTAHPGGQDYLISFSPKMWVIHADSRRFTISFSPRW